MDQANFSHWAILEVFGHEKYAGKVSTETIGSTSMIKLEVPEIVNEKVTLPGFIKFLNHTSIFSITPVTEEYAKEMAKTLSKHPIEGYEHRTVIEQLAQRMTEQMTLNKVEELLSRKHLVSSYEE